MKWPLVLRSTHDRVIVKLGRCEAAVRDRDRHLARMGHRVEEVKREHAKLLTDLRLVRVRIEYPSPATDRIRFMFEMHGGVFDGFRGDTDFVGLLAYMIEGQMRQTPEGRSVLAGLYR